jgi:PGF-CTERM protein
MGSCKPTVIAGAVVIVAVAGLVGVAIADHGGQGEFVLEQPEADDSYPGEQGTYNTFITLNNPQSGQHWEDFEALDANVFHLPDQTARGDTQDVRAVGWDRGGDQDGTQTDDSGFAYAKSTDSDDTYLVTEYYDEEDTAGNPPHWNHDDEFIIAFDDCFENPDEPMWTRWWYWANGTTTDGEYQEIEIFSHWIPVCECDDREAARQILGPPPSEEAEGSVEFADQASSGATVTVDAASLSHGGYIAVYEAPPSEAGPNDVIGTTPYLEFGDHSEIDVILDREPEDGETLYAVVHRDERPYEEVDAGPIAKEYGDIDARPPTYNPKNKEFDYVDTGGDVDVPYEDDGSPVAASAVIGQSEETEATAAISFDDQETTGTSLSVKSVFLPDGGYVVLYPADVGPDADVVLGKSGYLEAGSHSDIQLQLTESLEASTEVRAAVHQESTGDEAFDYADSGGTDDPPYRDDGNPVTDSASIQLLEATWTVQIDAVSGAESGETIDIEVEITNDGDRDGSATTVISFGGETVESQEVTLKPGESTTVSTSVEVTGDPGTTHEVRATTAGGVATHDVEVLEPGGEDGGTEDDGTEDGENGGAGTPNADGDGFTPVVGVVALLASVLLARRIAAS